MSTPTFARSGAVTASAVIAILGSVLVLLFAGLGMIGVALMQNMPARPGLTPTETRYAGIVGVGFILALGVWGLATGIALLGYRNWARISTLVWSGLTVTFGTLLLIFTSSMKLPAAPNAPPGAESVARGFIVFFYGIPIAIGIWWLILFTRRSIAALFLSSPVAAGAVLDASGFPATAPKRGVPLPVAVVAWFLIVAGAFAAVFLALRHNPILLFGQILRGPGATGFQLVGCAICIFGGLGLLKLRLWSFWLLVCYQVFGLINGTVSALSPNHLLLVKEIRASSQAAGKSNPLPDQFFQSISIVVLVFIAVPLAILIYYRSHFLAAPSADSAD
jgi:hypothetical protein